MLESMRARINELDIQLADLLSERMRLSEQIGEEKLKLGLPVLDDARERELHRRWEKAFSERGLSPFLAHDMLELVLKESRRVQLRTRKPSEVMIVGEGRMGILLERCFSDAGNRVTRVGAASAANAYSGQKFVILALPPDVRVDLSFAKEAIVMDIASSKASIFPRLEKESQEKGFSYVSAHPLFGAVEDPLEERVVIIPSRTSGDALSESIELWRDAGFNVIVTSLEVHELAMSAVQVMVHAHLLSLMESLEEFKRKTGIDPYYYETRTVRRLRPIIQDVSANMRVVREIREQNQHSKEALELSLRVFTGIARGEGA